MMLASRLRQVLSGICTSLTNLTITTRPPTPPTPSPRHPLRLGTFNVCSIASQRKRLDTLPDDLRRYGLDILALQETKICADTEQKLGTYTLLTLPCSNPHYGSGFVIAPHLRRHVHKAWAVSDRICTLQLRIPSIGRVNIINAYAPHMGRPIDDGDRFYADLETAHAQLARRDLTFVLGDLNAKLGKPEDHERSVGPYARGHRNRNGQLLAQFCELHNLAATNTFFRKRARHLTTWTQRRQGYCIYNQIDYILCPAKILKLCTNAQSWGGTLTDSDHKLVTADFRLSSAKLRHRHTIDTPKASTLARDRLTHDAVARDTFVARLHAAMATDKDNSSSLQTSAPQRWQTILTTAYTAAEDTVGYNPPRTTTRHHDDLLATMSKEQKRLRLLLHNDLEADPQQIRRARNKLLHQIRDRCTLLAREAIDRKVEAIESLSNTSKMHEATRALIHRPTSRPTIRDPSSKFLLSHKDANSTIRSHFQSQFTYPTKAAITNDPTALPLTNPIQPDELARAFKRLNNHRASGPDNIPAEILKYGADSLSHPLATAINDSFATGQHLQLGEGILICLQKPNKPRGKCSSLRPIVLLNSVRKAISLVVLNRISPKIENYVSAHQSGFRPSRSTADAIWAHRWISARIQRYRETFYILGIDLSRAFDTIDRSQLLSVLATILDDDEIRLIRMLLTNTTLTLRSGSQLLDPITSNIGTPQGDSLSPVLFIVYLEAALRDLAANLDVPTDFLDQIIAYADDTDFICRSKATVDYIQEHAPPILARWSLTMNTAKTELTTMARLPTGTTSSAARTLAEPWRSTQKLGSLLGDLEDLSRRKQLASAALRRMWTIWLRPSKISEATRIRLYNCYVLPILLYNSGTWALTHGQLQGLESFHRRQLRLILGFRHPRRISNDALYRRCNLRPLRYQVTRSRWSLLGHILRRSPSIPANLHMTAYFSPSADGCWKGRRRTTLPVVLDQDLASSSTGHRLQSLEDLEQLRDLAQDRAAWGRLIRAVVRHVPCDDDSTYANTALCRGLGRLSLAP